MSCACCCDSTANAYVHTCSVVIRCGSRLSKPTTLSMAATRLSEGKACRCFTTDTSSRAEYLCHEHTGTRPRGEQARRGMLLHSPHVRVRQ